MVANRFLRRSRRKLRYFAFLFLLIGVLCHSTNAENESATNKQAKPRSQRKLKSSSKGARTTTPKTVTTTAAATVQAPNFVCRRYRRNCRHRLFGRDVTQLLQRDDLRWGQLISESGAKNEQTRWARRQQLRILQQAPSWSPAPPSSGCVASRPTGDRTTPATSTHRCSSGHNNTCS